MYRVGVEVGGAPGGPRGWGARPRGAGAPPPSWTGGGPPGLHLLQGFFYYFWIDVPWSFRSFRELLFLDINNTITILLKTTSVRVSSIQIMQVRVQNKGKSVWKSRYVGDVSTPPSLNLCLSSSNSVDKLKEIKKNFYKLYLILLLQICKASIQVFSKDYELTQTFWDRRIKYRAEKLLLVHNNT